MKELKQILAPVLAISSRLKGEGLLLKKIKLSYFNSRHQRKSKTDQLVLMIDTTDIAEG